MKLQIVSDLHLDFAPFEWAAASDADVVVLAGDIGRPAQSIPFAAGLGKPVVYVPGNHEYYGGSIDATAAELKRMADGTTVNVLDAEVAVIGGVRFVGATLWTDFDLLGEAARPAAMEQARRVLRDFTRIRAREARPDAFSPEESVALFERHARFIDTALDTPHDGPTVVVTHHAPSPFSIHARFAGSPINVCFVSDATRLMRSARAALWVHGHTHDSFDYRQDGVRVVCNPRGYARNGVEENAAFDPRFTVAVG